MQINNPIIVRRPSPSQTFSLLEPGQSATYRAQDLALYSTALVAVKRLNKRAGADIYTIHTDDNGATYTVARKSDETW